MKCTKPRSTFEEAKVIRLSYRNCKKFLFERSSVDVVRSCTNSYDKYKHCFSSTANKHAPNNIKRVRVINAVARKCAVKKVLS